jgi:hypothetical protein
MHIHLLYDIALGVVTGVIAGLIVEWLALRHQLRQSALGKMLLSQSAEQKTKSAGYWIGNGRWTS